MPGKGPEQYFPVPEEQPPLTELLPDDDAKIDLVESMYQAAHFVPKKKKVVVSTEDMYREEQPEPEQKSLTPEEIAEEKNQMRLAIDTFYQMVGEARAANPVRTIPFQLAGSPVFQKTFRQLVMKYRDDIAGVAIFPNKDNIGLADAFHFVRLDRRKYS